MPARDSSSPHASDLSRSAGGGGATERSRVERETQRNETANRRDATACSRDLAADVRDRMADDAEAGFTAQTVLAEVQLRDSVLRVLLSTGSVCREGSAADRAGSASDRHYAASDRAEANADSSEARTELEQAQFDGLTGAHRRDLGTAVLEQEIERARRSGESFALAFIDVDGLKQINDRDGHAAGDSLLQAVVDVLRTELRSYDPIVRVGGDEFVCGLTNTKLEASRRRIEEIRHALRTGPAAASISVGVAMLGDRDTLAKLVARADADMYADKQRIPRR